MRRLPCILFLFLGLSPGESNASCAGAPTPREAFDEATVVFSGTVIDRIDHSDRLAGKALPGAIEYVFKVESIWKGPIRDTFGIFPLDEYKVGDTYFIYAKVWGSKVTGEFLLDGGPCARSVPIEQALWDRAVLREPYIVDPTKVRARPTVAKLEEMAAGHSYLAAAAKRALEDIRSHADSTGGER